LRERNADRSCSHTIFPSSYPDMTCFFPTTSRRHRMEAKKIERWMLKYAVLALTLALIGTYYAP